MKKQDIAMAVANASKAIRGTGAGRGDWISLEAKDGKLDVSAASNGMKIKASCVCESDLSFRCTVKALLLAMTIERMPASDIGLRLTQEGLLVCCDFAEVTLPTTDFNQVVMEDSCGEPVIVEELAKYTSQITHALGLSTLHPMMGAIHLEIYEDHGIRVTALDGKRFAIRNTAGKGAAKVAEYNVPGHDLDIALKMMGDNTITIYKADSDNYIRMEKEGLVIIIGLVDGQYFDIEKTRERNFTIHLTVERAAFESAIELVRMLSRVTLVDVNHEGILLHGQDAMGKTQMFVPANVKGLSGEETFKTAFNTDFLSSAVKFLPTEQIHFHAKSMTSQVCLTDGETAIETVLPVLRRIP